MLILSKRKKMLIILCIPSIVFFTLSVNKLCIKPFFRRVDWVGGAVPLGRERPQWRVSPDSVKKAPVFACLSTIFFHSMLGPGRKNVIKKASFDAVLS
jgi:hypothetical protein